MSTLAEQPIKSHRNSHNNRRNPNFPPNGQKKFLKSRKRSKSFSGCGLGKIKTFKPVLPTKFLLGGNINDPLNLNSLQDEEINRAMNAVTPKSSPIPTPPRRRGQVEVIIPPNINDPLNLIDCADDAEYEQQLCSPIKKGRKKKPRKKRTMSGTLYSDTDTGCTEAKVPDINNDSAKIPATEANSNENTVAVSSTASTSTTAVQSAPPKDMSLDLAKKEKVKRKSEEHKDALKKFKLNAMDKIVSPVIPQPGAWLKRNPNARQHKPQRNQNKDAATLIMPKFKEKDKQYQYGNYNRYYGYRNPQQEVDPRLKCFSYYPEIFEGKDILDIGCNIGHITLSVAHDFGARSIVGIDIDKNLINIARKNVKYYVSSTSESSPPVTLNADDDMAIINRCPRSSSTSSNNHKNSTSSSCTNSFKSSEFFPISMPILYGPIDIPGFNDSRKGKTFPNNVTFIQGNYVLEDDALLSTEQPQFDVILCLSITKWLHLNWGDQGIKRAFRRMYAQLRPGGKLILEPQSWASYKIKKKLTETIYRNYNTIEFFPENFTQYLLSPEVGFAKSEILGYPQHQSKGFQRPIQVYTKSTMFPSERVECTGSSFHDSGSSGNRVYAPLPTPEPNYSLYSNPTPPSSLNFKSEREETSSSLGSNAACASARTAPEYSSSSYEENSADAAGAVATLDKT